MAICYGCVSVQTESQSMASLFTLVIFITDCNVCSWTDNVTSPSSLLYNSYFVLLDLTHMDQKYCKGKALSKDITFIGYPFSYHFSLLSLLLYCLSYKSKFSQLPRNLSQMTVVTMKIDTILYEE